MRFFSELSLLATSRSARSVFLTALAVLSWGTGVVENAVMGDLAVTTGLTDTVVAADKASAAAAAATPAKTQESTEDTVMTMMNVVVEGVMMLFLPATIIAGWLLSPDWTFGEIFGLRPILHQLWVLISNVVYVIFAFLLVGIAFMNIFWAGGDQYAIKKALPRFVVGILIVPFTWFAVSAILSISNILTASVLRLPADILQNVKGANDKEFMFKMPETCTLNFDKVSEGASATKSASPAKPDTPPTGKIFECGDATIDMTFRDILASDKGAYGILNVYAYGIFKVQDFKKIDSFSLKSVSGVLDMIISTGIWILFLFIFALLVLALTFALFTRAMYMWLIAVFSPLFGLFYFMEGKGKFAEEYGKKIGFASFVSLAMVPVYAAAALGFGLLFLKMVESAPIVAENSSFFSEAVGDKNSTTFRMGGEKKSVKIEVKGLPTGISEKAGKAGNIAGKGVALAGSAIGKIIVDVLGLVVLWLAVMAALNSSEITKQAVSPISEFGASMGKLIKSLPQHTPIPLPGGHKMSMSGLQTMGSQISQSITNASAQTGWEIGRRIGEKITGGMGMHLSEASKHMQNHVASHSNPPLDKIRAGEDITRMLSYKDASLKSLFQEKTARDTLANRISHYSNDIIPKEKREEIVKTLRTASDETDLAKAFKELEHAIPTLGGQGMRELGTSPWVDDWLKSLWAGSSGSSASGSGSSSWSGTASKINIQNRAGGGVTVEFGKQKETIPTSTISNEKLKEIATKLWVWEAELKGQLEKHWVTITATT